MYQCKLIVQNVGVHAKERPWHVQTQVLAAQTARIIRTPRILWTVMTAMEIKLWVFEGQTSGIIITRMIALLCHFKTPKILLVNQKIIIQVIKKDMLNKFYIVSWCHFDMW